MCAYNSEFAILIMIRKMHFPLAVDISLANGKTDGIYICDKTAFTQVYWMHFIYTNQHSINIYLNLCIYTIFSTSLNSSCLKTFHLNIYSVRYLSSQDWSLNSPTVYWLVHTLSLSSISTLFSLYTNTYIYTLCFIYNINLQTFNAQNVFQCMLLISTKYLAREKYTESYVHFQIMCVYVCLWEHNTRINTAKRERVGCIGKIMGIRVSLEAVKVTPLCHGISTILTLYKAYHTHTQYTGTLYLV